MPRLSNFTDDQKAAIYVRDRALCAYTGKSLWILDVGATREFAADWADHLYPVARGGLSTVENGVCAHWTPNKAKSASTAEPALLFRYGRPTELFLRTRGSLPEDLSAAIRRFETLHQSDWYFNRALYRLLLGVRYLCDGVGKWKRDDRYYGDATLKSLRTWRLIAGRENVRSLEARGLAPLNPRVDQQLMLDLRAILTLEQVQETMRLLLPFYSGQATAAFRSTAVPQPFALDRVALTVRTPPATRAASRMAAVSQSVWFHLFGVRVSHANIRYRVAGTPDELILHRMTGDPLAGQTCPRLSAQEIDADLAQACGEKLRKLNSEDRDALAKVTAAMIERNFSQHPEGLSRDWTAF